MSNPYSKKRKRYCKYCGSELYDIEGKKDYYICSECRKMLDKVRHFNVSTRKRLKKYGREDEYSPIRYRDLLDLIKFFGGDKSNIKSSVTGKVIDRSSITLDHVVPLAKGGVHDIHNILLMEHWINEYKDSDPITKIYPLINEKTISKIEQWISVKESV